jgi:hypothetical protein
VSLPRVTEILRVVGLGPTFIGVDESVLEAARARGSAAHAAIEADHYGYGAEVAPEIAPYLDAYRKFVAESGHEAVASERAIIHPTWQYVGHIDRVGWLIQKRCLLDWKMVESVDLVCAGYQLAGYRLAWNAQHPTEPVDLTAVVQFRKDGTYRFHDVNAAEHEPVFLAAVTVYRALKENGR